MKNENILGDLLRNRGLKIAVAESCTGGKIGDMITDVPGASGYFVGGIIAYSNEAKINILNVSRETIEKYGAVSEECAREMAAGVASLFKAHVAIATTGIAGPTGGSKEKPVGLVYIAIKILEKTVVKRYIFKGDRKEIKRRIAEKAIEDAIILLKHEMV